MFRRPGTGASKAAPTTLCQKCLQRGHYSYECKARAQDRPYKPRPSRTQQLLNPRLAPALTTEVPTDLVRKKGVADDILKKKEDERLRGSERKRSVSEDSVSTVSTDAGRERETGPRSGGAKGKRRGRSSSASGSEGEGGRRRNARRRLSSSSPEVRGRRHRDGEGSRGGDGDGEGSRGGDGHGKRARRASRERSRSPYSQRRTARSPSPRRERNAGRNRFDEVPMPAAKQAPPPSRAAPRERSLSPFSKRVALTRAMNGS